MDIQDIKRKYKIVGSSSNLNRAIEIAVTVAPTDISVLITGESGVGKEVLPKIIHGFSKRKHKNYIAVNCGAIPEGTIDSELFGHEKGSFTDARVTRKGYFEEADNGTIFLDELGELPLSTQTKLLRVLETGEYYKVGSSIPEKTNVRIIAATNVNLEKNIQLGKFREDLFYRINAVAIKIEPLRKRKEDINLLFRKFSSDFAEANNMPTIRLDEDAIQVLENYYWKGNIRQLKNICEQISVLESDRKIKANVLKKYLPDYSDNYLPVNVYNNDKYFSDNEQDNNISFELNKIIIEMKSEIQNLKEIVYNLLNNNNSNINFSSLKYPNINYNNKENIIDEKENFIDTDEYDENYSIRDKEKELIIKALDKHKGKRKQAANELGISERTLFRKIKEFNL